MYIDICLYILSHYIYVYILHFIRSREVIRNRTRDFPLSRVLPAAAAM